MTCLGIVYSSCGGTINGSNVILKYPLTGFYPRSTTCSWDIRPGVPVLLSFLKVDLETKTGSLTGCYDDIKVKYGYFSESICNKEISIVIPQNCSLINVEFSSDGSNERKGFELSICKYVFFILV